jgi:hypothetical protein
MNNHLPSDTMSLTLDGHKVDSRALQQQLANAPAIEPILSSHCPFYGVAAVGWEAKSDVGKVWAKRAVQVLALKILAAN